MGGGGDGGGAIPWQIACTMDPVAVSVLLHGNVPHLPSTFIYAQHLLDAKLKWPQLFIPGVGNSDACH